MYVFYNLIVKMFIQ